MPTPAASWPAFWRDTSGRNEEFRLLPRASRTIRPFRRRFVPSHDGNPSAQEVASETEIPFCRLGHRAGPSHGLRRQFLLHVQGKLRQEKELRAPSRLANRASERQVGARGWRRAEPVHRAQAGIVQSDGHESSRHQGRGQAGSGDSCAHSVRGHPGRSRGTASKRPRRARDQPQCATPANAEPARASRGARGKTRCAGCQRGPRAAPVQPRKPCRAASSSRRAIA